MAEGSSTHVIRGNRIGDVVPEGWYTRGQASKLCGRSVDTLKRWQKSPAGPHPSGKMQAGELWVWLYSEDDIEELRQAAATRRPGRPSKIPDGEVES